MLIKVSANDECSEFFERVIRRNLAKFSALPEFDYGVGEEYCMLIVRFSDANQQQEIQNFLETIRDIYKEVNQ